MNKFSIIKISIFVLAILFVLYINVGLAKLDNNMEKYTNLTYNISGRAILFCNESTYASMELLYKGNASGSYVIAANDILRYVYGASIERYIAEKLHGVHWVVLATRCGLHRPVNITKVGSTLFIYIKANKCNVSIPVIVDVYGTINIEKLHDNNYLVTAEINMSMPLDRSVKRRFNLIDSSCIPRQIALRLFNGDTIKLRGRRLVEGSVAGYAANNGNSRRLVVWKTPFIVTYPRNASEIREVLEKRIEVKYLDTSLQFLMLNISVRRAQYGRPTRWVTVPVIKAIYAYYGFYTALRQAILPLTQYPYRLRVAVPVIHGKPFKMLIGPNGDLSIVYDVIVNALAKGSVNIDGYKDSYLLVPIYTIMLSEPEEPPSLLYHYMYPVSFNYFPVILKANGSRLLLGLEADAVYPPWFDPYSVNIGFYGPRRASCSSCGYMEFLPLLVVGVGVVVVVMARKRRVR